MFDFDDDEIPHYYPLLQTFVNNNISTLQPWNKVSTPHYLMRNHKNMNKDLNKKANCTTKTQQSFYSNNISERRAQSIQKRRKIVEEKEQFPIQMLNFNPECIGIQLLKKRRKVLLKVKNNLRSAEKFKSIPSSNSISEKQIKQQVFKGLKPSFDYTALLKRKEQNKIKYKTILSRNSIHSKINQSFFRRDINDHSSKVREKQQKIVNRPNKSLSFNEIRSNGSENHFKDNKIPKKPFFAGILKIMCEKY